MCSPPQSGAPSQQLQVSHELNRSTGCPKGTFTVLRYDQRPAVADCVTPAEGREKGNRTELVHSHPRDNSMDKLFKFMTG